jgi:hypothetical protein
MVSRILTVDAPEESMITSSFLLLKSFKKSMIGRGFYKINIYQSICQVLEALLSSIWLTLKISGGQDLPGY